MDDYSLGFGIETRYHGPTNSRGSRVSARFTDDRGVGPVWVDYDDALDSRAAHEAAARKLLGRWVESYPYKASGFIQAACGAARGWIFIAQTRKVDE